MHRYRSNTMGILSGNMYPMVIDNNNSKINCFLPGQSQQADRDESARITQQLEKEF